MPTLIELREKRAGIWAQAQEFRDRAERADDMSAEDEAAWKRALDEIDALATQIDTRERDAELDKRFAAIDADTIVRNGDGDPDTRSKEQYRSTFLKFLRHGAAELDVEERTLLRSNFSTPSDPQLRALSTTVGAAGGYTVPEGFWAKVTETMKFFGGALEGAEIIGTDSGNPLPWPTNDDTANEGYYLGENVPATNEADLVFGQKELGAFTCVSGPGLVALALLQDTGIDIESFIARKMGERIGRRSNRAFTVGTGSSQPQGYITGATTGKTTAGATAITYNEITDLIHSVDAAYRATGRCRFKLHDLVLAYVRKIRDDSGGAGLGRPIWEPSVQVGVPDSLLGYGVTVNNDMDSTVATTKKTIAFGDYTQAFVVRKVNGGQMMRLAERYAEALQVGFIAFERHDSLVQDSSAVKLLVQT